MADIGLSRWCIMGTENGPTSETEKYTSAPCVSVLLPAYNAAGTIAEAAASVLTGNDVTLELIIIDDGSTDGTSDIVKRIARDCRVRVISQKNLGLAASLNNGIAVASAPLIARMDADDISTPGRLDRQFQFLSEHHDVVLVGGQIRRIVNGEPQSTSDLPLEHREIVDALLRGHHAICHASVMMRKSALDATGGYWNHGVSEDCDLFLRLSEVGTLANLDRPLYDVTYHDEGIQASGMEAVRANIGLAICNHDRRSRGLMELDPETYLDNLGLWGRTRIHAQTRSLKAYRRSMQVGTSNRTVRRLLLAEAAILWPPFAARRIPRPFFRN